MPYLPSCPISQPFLGCSAHYGFGEHARRLRETTSNLVREAGSHEYFHPTSGHGHGSNFFSWTAAPVIDLLPEGMPETKGRSR